MNHRYLTLAAAALMLFSGAPAWAADQTILGKFLLVKDPAPDASPDPAKRKIKVYGKENPSTATIVGDPVADGATLRIVANGMTNYDQTFPMPAGGWTTNAPGIKYKYKDFGTFGPVKKASLYAYNGKFQFKVFVHGAYGLITIEAPNPGTDGAAALTILGTGDRYCMMYGGAAGGTVINEPQGNPFRVFKIVNPTAENGCPP
jgi:hypothetical protein